MGSIAEDLETTGNLRALRNVHAGNILQADNAVLVWNQAPGAGSGNFPRVVAVPSDPSIAGRTADIGSIAMCTAGAGSLWQKTGAPDTSWTQITGSGAGLSGSPLTLTPKLNPPALAPGTTNNYAPTGLASASVMTLTPDAAGSTLTGLVAQPDGRVIIVESYANGLTLAHESASSTAANRFNLPGNANITLNVGDAIILIYDGSTSRWRAAALTVKNTTAQKSVTVANTPYTILPTDDYLMVNTTGGPVLLVLPNPAQFGYAKQYFLVDVAGTFNTNNCTLAPFAGEMIEGVATNKVFQTAWGGWTIVTDGTNWFVY